MSLVFTLIILFVGLIHYFYLSVTCYSKDEEIRRLKEELEEERRRRY